MVSDWLSEVNFCIKTYKRPQALDRLLASIGRYYPNACLTVNSHPELHTGRNEMVDATDRPYLLFLDDDFEFDDGYLGPLPSTVWHLMSRFHEGSDLGICAGGVVDCMNDERTLRNSGGLITRDNGSLRLDACEKVDANYRGYVDVVPNFFLARREVFETARWRWGVGAEHIDFFMQLLGKWKVYQDRRFTILHHIGDPESMTSEYRNARWNIGEPVRLFLDHWDIDRVVVNGKVVHSRPVYA